MSRFEHKTLRRLPAILALGFALTAAAASATWAHEDGHADQPYALVRAGVTGMTGSGDRGDWFAVKQAKARIKGDFLWFRENGRAWVIRDPDTLAKARAAWADVDRLGDQMNVCGRDMDQQGKAMGALGMEMGRAGAAMKPDEAKMHAIERQMDALGRRMGELGRQMGPADDGERVRLDAEMATLSVRMGQLGGQMGAAAQPVHGRQAQMQMKEIGLRMENAKGPMEALGRKMDALGKDIDRASHAADQTVHALIRDARARGLAQPAP
ncbi:hypothetical protein [Massilia sp. 9096]|uniref:hypothetical protein n=1 Tax=Massilia sp. 9096 TaxID=1500894 RepID=UPI0012E03264|nr:hypothetical protein [Massilia sp. 9096]